MICTSTLLVEDLFVDILPTPNVSFILFKSEFSRLFLFVIIVVDIVDVVPVFVTSYPAFFRRFTASCNFELSPLPFITSIFIFELLLV